MLNLFRKNKSVVPQPSNETQYRTGNKLFDSNFFKGPKGEWRMENEEGDISTITQKDTDIINFITEYFGEYYPEALKDAQKEAKRHLPNRPLYNYRTAWLLVMCNLSEYNGQNDINSRGLIRLEFVNCPLRGFCKSEGIRCKPQFNSRLSKQQKTVMRMLYYRHSIADIANTLGISVRTVESHRRYALGKLNIHSTSDFISYAAEHRMFD